MSTSKPDKNGYRRVLVLLEVYAPADIPVPAVRQHIAREAQIARGQFSPEDWRANISVKQKSLRTLRTRLPY